MDSTLTAAAMALATGDVLGALNRVALRSDPPALALNGIAMARLGDFGAARTLLRRAGQGFGRREEKARARCVVAEAEIALVSRDLAFSPENLAEAEAVLEASGDRANALHARLIGIRRALLLGQLQVAEASLSGLVPSLMPPPLQVGYWLAKASLAMRNLHAAEAAEHLGEARRAAAESRIAALTAEVDGAEAVLTAPAAILRRGDDASPVDLGSIERLFATEALVVDATRHLVRQGTASVTLASRPVLFALVEALAEHFPQGVARETLLKRAFGARHADESHRARLRVEMTRLRQALAPLAGIVATETGYRLEAKGDVALLSFPLDHGNANVLALLADGELWSSSALALVLGLSARTVQRALEALQRAGAVEAIGQGRSRRWVQKTLPGFPTVLLAPPVG